MIIPVGPFLQQDFYLLGKQGGKIRRHSVLPENQSKSGEG